MKYWVFDAVIKDAHREKALSNTSMLTKSMNGHLGSWYNK